MEDESTQNASTKRIAAGIVAAIALAAGGWWFLHRAHPAAPAVAATTEKAADAGSPAAADDQQSAAVQFPLTADVAGAAVAAPDMANSDATLTTALASLFGEQAVADWLVPDSVARRLVATVDNLSRNTRVEQLRPVRAPAGAFVVQRETLDAAAGTEQITLSEQNFVRYDMAVALVERTDMHQLATVYRQVYPVLQRAYEDLGYPDHYFNDRVVQTIDHLLATPEPSGPIRLLQPKVLYQYEDADLERRSAGQKLLLRMGPVHAGVIKAKLRELRAAIVTKP